MPADDASNILTFAPGLTRAGDHAAKVVDFVAAAVDARLGAGTADRWTARIDEQKRIANDIERVLAEVARPPLDWPTRESMACWIVEYGGEGLDVAQAVRAARNSFAGIEPHLSAYAAALEEAANPHVHAQRLRIQAAEQMNFVAAYQAAISEKLAHAANGSGSLSPDTQVREAARLARGIGTALDLAADLMARAAMLAGGK